ncbi:MAG: L-seryl-tRNA(Sec) selenium transferase [Planctomycetes bacterium RBG_13_63_9]|nr:MAG: L-seryl-tRNA(Sec) selenium transferase [Planctomycetes bacterium RBG_13_63_9]
MLSPNQESLRRLPGVDTLLQDARLQEHAKGVPQRIVVDSVRVGLAEARKRLIAEEAGAVDQGAIDGAIVARALEHIRFAMGRHYRRVINATGIILHTALGRAVLPARALRQIEEELSGYSLLQADIESGSRSGRDRRIEWLFQQLTGTEAATVVNNNAAATMIALNTVGRGKEVIVSRGHLVEIGGSFRLPEVMAASGARLVEVGTTNKTHARDYERAITENTAALMRVHPSNYKISGFTSEVSLHEMVAIAHAHGLPLIDDVGAGSLIDFARFGFDPEPTLLESVREGADLITASADKLIGASQGGVILGKAQWIAAVRSNPLARVVRVGKLTLAALEATLSLFLDESVALKEVPTLRMLDRSLAEITEQARRICQAIGRGLDQERGQRSRAAIVTDTEGSSQMGSGSLPTQNLATRLVAISPTTIEPGELALRLRRHEPPVFTRVHKGQLLIDPRTLQEGEEDVLVGAVVTALRDCAGGV